ncbi:ribonuclease H-like domain-containing protein [Defluviitalea saccharophila]|uniref:Ribonuclease H-like domain-containing protein n=1 Tax=Defluviitalea saccharophila TaxID=879970 RepID=A0ABZ2Y4K6_9FIRM
MIEIYKPLSHSLNIQSYFPLCKNENSILFDIETTGFSRSQSQLYLIGCIYFKNNIWILHQFFSEHPEDEIELLMNFFRICDSFKYIIHFNGNTFDIPYLEEKASLLNIPCPLKKLESIDILKDIRPFQNILGLENCRLKTIESFLKINRNDPYTGGELIEQYYDYCKNKNESLKNNLLLHNEEDLYGLIKILKIYDYISFFRRLKDPHFIINTQYIGIEKNKLLFSLEASLISPLTLTIKNGNWTCKIYEEKTILEFEIELINTTLYHYFQNYKEYYYISELDEAIHKSVASFLPKEKRKPAAASNCYIKRKGLFLQIMNEKIHLPTFKENINSKEKYIHIEPDKVLEIKDEFIELAIGFFQSILPKY